MSHSVGPCGTYRDHGSAAGVAGRNCQHRTAAAVGENYVTVVTAREGWFAAKYSILGTSLLSILRGARGPWDRVEAMQRDYVQQPTAQLACERSQLRALAAHTRRTEGSLRVPTVIAYQDGVLISTASSGSSLAAE